MKKTIDVHGYGDNDCRDGGKRHPLVHILGHDSEHAELSSFTFKPKFAKKLCDAIMCAAEEALAGAEDFEIEVKVKDWQ